MESETAVARTFRTEIDAELARATLFANGIPALVQTNDAAGILRHIVGVQVVVTREDLELARQVLDAAFSSSDTPSSPGSPDDA